MFPSYERRLKLELDALERARLDLKEVTDLAIGNQMFLRKTPGAEQQFKNAVLSQRQAFRGVRSELNQLPADQRKYAEEKLTRVLVKTQ